MAFNLSKQIDVRSTCSNIDILYGPYNSIEEANSVVTKARRALGRTVGIVENNSIEEYWYKSGIEDIDLVKKISDEVPMLRYTEDFPEGVSIKKDVGETLSIKVNFTSPTYGQCIITVNKDGALFKTFKTNKGIITLDLGVQNVEGTSTYSITAIDALTIPAEQELTFKVVVGGASINTDFQSTIDSGINTSSDLSITYNASVADTSKTIKVYGEILYNGVVKHTYEKVGSGETPNRINEEVWNIGVLKDSGNYTISMWAYTGTTIDDVSEDNVTKNIKYEFLLFDYNDFAIYSDIDSKYTDSNTAVSVPFRIYSGGIPTLKARGDVYPATFNSKNQKWEISGESITGYYLNRDVASNVINYWSLGKVNAGDYIIRLYALTTGQEEAPSGTTYVDIYLHVDAYSKQYTVIRDGLLAEFLADGKSNNNDKDTRGVWENEVLGSNIAFELHDLNYNTNGWKHVDSNIPDTEASGEMMLKFSGDSYGILKQGNSNYNPFSLLSNPINTGLTCEIIFRSKCIGELNTKVITGHDSIDSNKAGFSATYDKVTLGSDASVIKYDVAEDEWIHATLVVDKTIHTDTTDLQDYAPKKLMTVYINGSMCSAAILTDNMTFNNYGPVLLNSALNTISGNIEFFGQCDIKSIRFYNRPLYASEVVNNYIASIYSESKQNEIAGRNGDVLPIVKFVNINASHPQNPLPDGVTLIDFATLNQMTEKSKQKKNYVCCTTYYQENSNSEVITWPRTIVQTQGTSTLAFPVKNYKVKIYDPTSDAYSKKWTKCSDYVNVFENKGWDKEYQFTLKCDYMEAAHLNNTPSCIFYNEMIDTLVESGQIKDGWNEDRTVYSAADDERTPSRRENHFDAIKGFPCLVYYYESEADYYNNNGTYVGTYMFNLDKSADSLGFEEAAIISEDGEGVIQIEDPRTGEYVDHICQSFEGKANKSDSAGCFFSYEAWKESYYNTYCQAAFEIYVAEGNEEITTLEEFIQYYSIDYPNVKYRTGHTKPVEFEDNGFLFKKDAYIEATKDKTYKDEYDYFASDYEMRYDWDDLEEGGEEFWGNSEWGLKRMIDWVSDRSQNLTLFKEEFNQYFNFKYCALYYLQMMTFGQVDNAGKNSMWDSWDGKIWAPRPYDCDTMAGLDNTGFEVIDPDAELIQTLSPFKKENKTTGIANYSEDVGDKANIRYRAYNTRTSRFWISFGTAFATEINALYKTLRDSGIYTIENIMSKFIGNTSGIIGEVYYNRDMTTKFYRLADIDTFISRMHGNRVQRFRAWMTDRLAFCDSLFDYNSTITSINNPIAMRSDAVETGGSTISLNVGIKTYSPQYIRFNVGSGEAIIEAYCSPDAKYIDPITGETKEGTLFTIPLSGGDKEITITGGGNIREFINLGALRPKSLTLTNATRITNLDLANSTKLLALALQNNTYLQYLDCSGAIQLGTDASGAQLDLSNCANLKEVLLDKTKLTSVVFPIGGALKKVSIANTTITGIELDSLYFLTDVNVDNCENIILYKIVNCPKIQSITADSLPLNSVIINNCKGLESISLQNNTAITSFNIALCPEIKELNLTNNRSAAVSILDLTTLYNITDLNIGGSIVTRIKFPLNTSSTSTNPWGSNFKSLNMSGSNLKYIQYGESESDAVDMKQLTGLNTLSFKNCNSIEKIINLNYTGSCYEMFSQCTSLKSVQGRLNCDGSASYLFYNCLSLNDIDNLTFGFTNCSSLSYAFSYCPRVKYSSIKRVLDNCGTLLTNLSAVCYYKKASTVYENEPDLTNLPNYFFGNCKNVTSISSAFYGSGLENLPISAFVDSSGNCGLAKCDNCNIAFGNNKLKSIPTNIVRYLPSAKTLGGLFINNPEITTTIPSNFFSGASTLLENIYGMFYGCSNLNVNISSMKELLKPLTNLKIASLVFSGCTKCVGQVPAGFFANNTNLTDIAGFFRNTSITGFSTEGSLFKNETNTTGLTKLTNISGLFEGCSSLEGNVRSELFEGALKVTDAGIQYYTIPSGSSIRLEGVFYNCNKLQLFGSDIFNNMPSVKNISGFFKNCSSLLTQIGGNFNDTAFNTLANLTDIHDLFYGCTSLTVTKIPNLFAASKNTIYNASGLFYGCSNISDFDVELFTNMSRLTNTSNAFRNCTSLSSLMTDLNIFDGCTSLQNVSGMFYGCENIIGSVPVVLFNSCRNTIQDTSYMFYGCSSLDGNIDVGNEDSIDSSSNNYQLGLLANCLKLTSTAYMFYNCNRIVGSIPWDLFYTDNVEKAYTQLKDVSYMFYNVPFGTPTYYAVDDIEYLIHPEFFSKLQSVTTMEGMFKSPWNKTHTWENSYPIHPNAFDGQYTLTTIKEMFHRCDGLGGTIDSNWFKNSITKLVNAYGAFAFTKVDTVGNTFLRTSITTANNKLTNVGRMFYNCSNITSTLPPCNNPAAFSKIDYSKADDGYIAFCYNCTNATNYSTFTEPWIRSVEY